jgi:hypothetical protein
MIGCQRYWPSPHIERYSIEERMSIDVLTRRFTAEREGGRSVDHQQICNCNCVTLRFSATAPALL